MRFSSLKERSYKRKLNKHTDLITMAALQYRVTISDSNTDSARFFFALGIVCLFVVWGVGGWGLSFGIQSVVSVTSYCFEVTGPFASQSLAASVLFISLSISSTSFGHSAVRTSGPFSVISTSSSILMPIPRYL